MVPRYSAVAPIIVALFIKIQTLKFDQILYLKLQLLEYGITNRIIVI